MCGSASLHLAAAIHILLHGEAAAIHILLHGDAPGRTYNIRPSCPATYNLFLERTHLHKRQTEKDSQVVN
jgi:hypothetical protein